MYNLMALIVFFSIMYVHLYMYIKMSEKISGLKELDKFMIAPIKYIYYTVKAPTRLNIIVVCIYLVFFLFLLVVVIANI